MSIKKRIIELYEDLENLLISEIDSNTNIQDEKALEYYMMAVYPEEYSLYCFIRNMLERKEKNNNA